MRAKALLPLLYLPAAWGVPASELQTVLNQIGDISGSVFADGLFGDITKGVSAAAKQAEKILHQGHEKVEKWSEEGTEYVKQNGLTYELVTNPAFAEYQLRVTNPHLCDPSVKQHSGYLDISDGKHLFFWFFESRNNPKKAPLTLWLNGGPGCSSVTGLLFELGPCRIAKEGQQVVHNNHSWNTHSNIIFLDQPVNVGYSYSSDGTTVNNSPVAAEDVYAFLELFLDRYPQYAESPFHIAAESYGGVYAPNIASVIHKKNNELASKSLAYTPHIKRINLHSVILANGLTEPYTQFGSIPDYACNGPYPIFDGTEEAQCQSLRTKVPTCQRLINGCYNYNSRFTCVPATLYCWSQLMGPLQQTGKNPYDARKQCDRQKDGQLCYKEMSWIDTWMNEGSTKKALGVPPNREFASCNMEVNQAFFGQGDGMHNAALLLVPLINDGVRLLVYAGNADMMCNYMGNEAWVAKLEHDFHEEFQKSPTVPWITLNSGKIAGETRSAGGEGFTAGNVTFVNVYEAGHMVPFDQPEAALDMFTRWILDVPLSLNATEIASHMAVPFAGIL